MVSYLMGCTLQCGQPRLPWDISRTRHGAGQNAEKNIELLGDFPVKLTGTWNWPSIYDEQNDQWLFQEPKLEVPTIYMAYIRPM